MNRKRIIILSCLVIAILVISLGVTFAFFTYTKTSNTNSELVLGDIYMHYNETNQITIQDAMPSSTYDSTNYFEFTIDGKNTTTDKDIWYDIVLTHGDDHETRTTRIRDDLLKFRLVEVVDSEEVVLIDNSKYNDLTSKRIWVDTIDKNTTSEILHTYRLYTWIASTTKIGNVDQDYTMEEWDDVYASIKVNVTGDFIEKILPDTDSSCFTTTTNDDNTITITDYDKNCGTNVVIPKTIDGKSVTTIGEDAFSGKKIISVSIPDSVTTIKTQAFLVNQLTSLNIPDSVVSIGLVAFNNNLLPDDQAFIYARTDNDGDGIAEIDNTNIIGYGGKSTEIVVPNNVTKISDSAFAITNITSIIIPDSVISIERNVFQYTKLQSITIGSGISYIEHYAIPKDYGNKKLSSITINKSCSEIKNIPASSTDSTLYYPWLAWKSPYTASGVTIYGSGGEVCDSY